MTLGVAAPGTTLGAAHRKPLPMPMVTLEDLRHQLQRFALEPLFINAFIPRMEGLTASHQDEEDQTAKSLSTWYRRMGSLKSRKRLRAEIIRDVTNGDLDQDELVRAYAQQAITILNAHEAGTSSGEARDLLTMVAALATAIYSFWMPTIHAPGHEGWTHLQVKERLSSTSWTSWWEVRDYAPLIIGKTGGPRSVRTPLHQFLIHMRLRSTDRQTAEDRWREIRSVGHNAAWDDLVHPETVNRQQCERWMRGAIAIPGDFLSDVRRNPHCIEPLTADDRLRFATLRRIQLLWGLCARRMQKRHDLLARVFAGVMSIPYEGRLVLPPTTGS